MGVYIKGIEMPKSCCACPLFKSNMSKQLFCKAFGAFDKSDYDKLPIERMKNCPLVPVPPHGRMIDADALDTSILQAGFSYAITRRKLRYTPGEVREKIANAPTIIPAEEGE